MERKLATIRKIAEVKSIPEADKICAYRVDGWWVVDSVGKYNVDDLVVYIEPDAWVPHELAPFLSKGKEPREYNGVKGEKLKTVKLRGQVSQGLLLPLGTGNFGEGIRMLDILAETNNDPEGYDVTHILGIQKWEAPIPAEMAGKMRGNFPSFIPKTDAERIQNCGRDVFSTYANEFFEVTLKLDGTSYTAYRKDDVVGVCSRNIDLKLEGNDDNVYVKHFNESGLRGFLENWNGYNIAIQGELMGPGIQGNREGLTDVVLYVFNVFNIDTQTYLLPTERAIFFMDNLWRINPDKIKHVPIYVIGSYDIFYPNEFGSVDEILKFADGPSINHKVREGLVWKHLNSDFNFKAISNQFLLEEK